jgi:DNA-binding NtrC family response regulator
MPLSVLVVEDHTDLRNSLRDLLVHSGYGVRCASTVEEAISLLNSRPFPCLILWDPVTLDMGTQLISVAAQHGVHLATIPVGVSAKGLAPNGRPVISKKLTSRDAVLSVVREHCPEADARPAL